MDPNGWDEWGIYVIKQLEGLTESLEGLQKDVRGIHVEIATLKVKSGLWGAVGALVPVSVALAFMLLK